MTTAKVRIGSRGITVEQSPLIGRGSHFKFTLSQSEHGPLWLSPSRGVRVLGWIFCVIGWPILILGLFGLLKQFVMIWQNRLELADVVTVLVVLALGLPISVAGVKFRYPRFRFDKQTGELTIRYFTQTIRRRLADLVAVQVINAGRFGDSAESDGFLSYQLNLVFDDPNEPRLFVVYNSDLADMETKAKLLADFLEVPLVTSTENVEMPSKQNSVPRTNTGPDPTRGWAKSAEPLPVFDLSNGALGSLRLGDPLEHAEFLGRPDCVQNPGWTRLTYLERGFDLYFEMSQFTQLRCDIAPSPGVPTEPGQGYCRIRLSDGIELTPETSIAQVQERFGPPKNEEKYTRNTVLTYVPGRIYFEFEFEQATGKLLSWFVALND